MLKRFLSFFLISAIFASMPYDAFAALQKPREKQRRTKGSVLCRNLTECLERSDLPEKERTFLQDAIKEIEKSSVGRNIIAKMKGGFDFRFRFKSMPKYRWGDYGGGMISLNSEFLKYRNAEERQLNLIYCTSVIIHEMTHALHRRYKIRLVGKDPSWIARIQEVKLRELHCKLTQTEAATELARKYGSLGYFDKPSKSRVVAESKVWNEIITAKMEEGLSFEEANRSARETIARHLWQNRRYHLIIGKHKILLAMAQCWDVSYGPSAMNWNSPRNGKDELDEKDAKKILSWMDAGIDLKWLKDNFPYKTQDNILVGTEITNIYSGIERELKSEYVICDGFPMLREYHYDGKLIRITPVLRKVPGGKLKKDGTFIVKFPNGSRQAEYTVKNGMLNGLYQEWDSNGKLLFQVPFSGNKAAGSGMISENGKPVQVVFRKVKTYWGQIVRDGQPGSRGN